MFDISKNVKTKQSYENFRSAKKEDHPYFQPQNYNDQDDDSVIGIGNIRSMTNLKTSGNHKRAGILKFNTNVYNSNNVSALGMDEKDTTPVSTSAMNMNNEDSGYPDSYHKLAKRQVKLVDPNFNLGGAFSEASKSPYRKNSVKEEFLPAVFVQK